MAAQAQEVALKYRGSFCCGGVHAVWQHEGAEKSRDLVAGRSHSGDLAEDLNDAEEGIEGAFA